MKLIVAVIFVIVYIFMGMSLDAADAPTVAYSGIYSLWGMILMISLDACDSA